MTDPIGSTNWAFDTRGRVTSEIKIVQDGSTLLGNYSTSWTYNNADQVTGMIYPSGEDAPFTYDAENRLVSVIKGSIKVADYAYDGDGNRVLTKDYTPSQTNPDKTAYVGEHFEVFIDADYTPTTPQPPSCPGCTHKIFLPLVVDTGPKPPVGHTWKSYYYAGSARVAMQVQDHAGGVSGVFWIYTDHLGSTTVTANELGGLISELRYKAWGEDRAKHGDDADELPVHGASTVRGRVVLLQGEIL
jgi:YD repeat-containing protein